MKIRVLSLILYVALLSIWSGNVVFAQFTSDKVLIYVKAGVEPSKARLGEVRVIGFYSDLNEIRNMGTDAEGIRKTISSNPTVLKSPYNIPDKGGALNKTYIAPRWCKFNSSASTSKFSVYSGRENPGYNFWGQYCEGGIKNWAISKDGKQMIFWITGKEDNRITYLLTELSEFDPSTSSSSNYDFLE